MIARLRLCGEMIMHMLKGEVEVEMVDYVIDGCGRKDVDSRFHVSWIIVFVFQRGRSRPALFLIPRARI